MAGIKLSIRLEGTDKDIEDTIKCARNIAKELQVKGVIYHKIEYKHVFGSPKEGFRVMRHRCYTMIIPTADKYKTDISRDLVYIVCSYNFETMSKKTRRKLGWQKIKP